MYSAHPLVPLGQLRPHIRSSTKYRMHPYVAVPATAALVWRAYSRDSLTPAGLVVATLTASVHAVHPWSVFFALLVVFFLCGTAVTKVCSSIPGEKVHF